MPNSPDKDNLIDLNKHEPDPDSSHLHRSDDDVSGTGSYTDVDPVEEQPSGTIKPHTDDSDWEDWDREKAPPRRNRVGGEYRAPSWENYGPLLILIPLIILRLSCESSIRPGAHADLPFIIVAVIVIGAITWLRYRLYPGPLPGMSDDPDYYTHRMEARCLVQAIIVILLPIIILAIMFFSSTH